MSSTLRRRAVWCLLFLPVAAALLAACYTAGPTDRAALEGAESRKHRLQLTYSTGQVVLMPGWTLEYPFVVGKVDETKGTYPSEEVEGQKDVRRFNLDETTQMETLRLSPLRIAGLTGGIAVGVLGAAILIVLATSCPTVYIVDGSQQLAIVGEAYPGAIFRSVQRDDLLPLPRVDGPTLTLRLRNDNPEVQHTDSARLVLVEHRSNERVLATHDGRAVVVEAATPAAKVVDLNGIDVSAQMSAGDQRVWQSDLNAAYVAQRRDLREGVIASFASTPAGALALEIEAENTLWMSAVFHRGFAMTGSSFRPMMHLANNSSRAETEAWRLREGVDLQVEVLRDGVWTHAASVQSPGVVALRKMAVPIGRYDGEELQVRLTGGFGFWRIGSVALTTVVDDAPRTRTVVARSNADDLIGTKDGRYHVLRRIGDSIDLTFEIPSSTGAERTAFLATSGYYNPLPPRGRKPQLAELRSIRTTPGGLAAFGLDLYSQHREQLHER